MIEPYKGRIYDSCCGSSGMFVQGEKFVLNHSGRVGDLVHLWAGVEQHDVAFVQNERRNSQYRRKQRPAVTSPTTRRNQRKLSCSKRVALRNLGLTN
jgi:hypothetical protein